MTALLPPDTGTRSAQRLTAWPITDRQRIYISSLCRERGLPDEPVDHLDRKAASDLIEALRRTDVSGADTPRASETQRPFAIRQTEGQP